jgi:hypothetical protein
LKRIKEYQCVEVGQRIRLLRSNFHPRGTILFVCEVWEWMVWLPATATHTITKATAGKWLTSFELCRRAPFRRFVGRAHAVPLAVSDSPGSRLPYNVLVLSRLLRSEAFNTPLLSLSPPRRAYTGPQVLASKADTENINTPMRETNG